MLRMLLALVAAVLGTACGSKPPEVLLTWSDNSDDEECFVIERKSSGGDYQLLAVVDRDCESYVDRAVYAGEKYQYQIRAQNQAGCSNPVTSDLVAVDRPTTAAPATTPCLSRPLTDPACGTCPR